MALGPGRKRVAIVGSGVSGLGALYALRDAGHEVHLYEAQDRLGGHTNTIDFHHKDESIPVDTGFIVMNTATYPNFISFLKELNVETMPTDMTFGVSRDAGTFEWSGTSPASIFAQRSNRFRPSFWCMIFDIVRFNQFALDLLNDDAPTNLSIGDYLEREGYSEAFKNDYLMPMTACVWSTGPDKCALDFPAVTLVRFLWNHHLLSTVADRPPWLTIVRGSRTYIDAVLKAFPSAKIHLSTPVRSLVNGPDGQVLLALDDNMTEAFDAVILACHAPQAAKIVSLSASSQERQILGAFQTSENLAYLHSDISLMPRRHITWSSWNYLTSTTPHANHNKSLSNTDTSPKQLSSSPLPVSASNVPSFTQKVSLTYNMNILQHLSAPTAAPAYHSHPTSPSSPHILVTLNPPHLPDPSLTQAVIPYAHPIYTAAAINAQKLLPSIQGVRGVYYAGAWTGYGFHEDGFRSGVEVGCRKELGGNVGWELVDAREIRGHKPSIGPMDYVVRAVVLAILILLRLGASILGLLSQLLGYQTGRGSQAAIVKDDIVRLKVKNKT